MSKIFKPEKSENYDIAKRSKNQSDDQKEKRVADDPFFFRLILTVIYKESEQHSVYPQSQNGNEQGDICSYQIYAAEVIR